MRVGVADLFYFLIVVNVVKCTHLRMKKTLPEHNYIGKLEKLIEVEGGIDNSHIQEEKICRTSACKATAKEMLMNMNQSVDPCEDFYEFACGGWMARHPLPPTEARRNQFLLLNEKIDLQVKEMFEEDDGDEDPSPVIAAKQAYRSCMDEEAIEDEGLQPLVDLLDEFGGWPMTQVDWSEENFDWQDILAEITRRLAVTPLLIAAVGLDFKDTSKSVIMVDQTTLPLSRSMLIDPLTYSKQIEAYRQWVAACAWEVARALHEPKPKGKAKTVTKSSIAVESFNLIQFEMELAKISTPDEQRRDQAKQYNPMTLRTLQKLTDKAKVSHPHARIKWKRFLNRILKGVETVGPDERVILTEADYILRLSELLDRTPVRVIANCLQSRIAGMLGQETTKRMRELTFEFHKVLMGIKEEQPHWKNCVASVKDELSHATGYQYVQQYFDAETKNAAVEMVGYLREAFKKEVGKLTWMDQETKEAARQKADAMTQQIGYPRWYTNTTALEELYEGLVVGKSHFKNRISITTFLVKQIMKKLRKPTDRNEWNSGPAVINAYYKILLNSIVLPGGILQSPFFKKGRIQALNYGSIGAIMGHEIIHGFDDMGRQHDLHGNLVQWWSDSTIDTYLQKAQCFIDQYGSYRVPELDSLQGNKVMANGVITQGENIADNGGLQQALLAYRRFVQKHGPEPRLKGLEDYTPEQLFYLGFAMVWCESSTPESSLAMLLLDEHGLQRIRVRGTLSNSENFAKAFQCSSESTMNPEEKCRIW